MWQSTPQQARHIGFPPEYFFVGPASSFHQNETHFEQQNQHHSLNASIGVIPLLTATPCLDPNDDDNAALKLWQQHGQSSTYLKKVADINNHGTSVVSNTSSLGTATCQDCGNQAKKDCPHRRCRTCCKSRGYDCSTHVKSTWVPVARRRERQLLGVNATPTGGGGSSQSNSSAKRARLPGGASQTTSHTSTSNTTPPRSFDASSSHQDASFKESLPGQVRAPAVFKCVRVTAVDDGNDEYAYQAVVNIGGHVFKGFLYDQGVEGGKQVFPNMSELHLGGRNGTSSSGLDPSGIYGASGGGLLGGSNYGN